MEVIMDQPMGEQAEPESTVAFLPYLDAAIAEMVAVAPPEAAAEAAKVLRHYADQQGRQADTLYLWLNRLATREAMGEHVVADDDAIKQQGVLQDGASDTALWLCHSVWTATTHTYMLAQGSSLQRIEPHDGMTPEAEQALYETHLGVALSELSEVMPDVDLHVIKEAVMALRELDLARVAWFQRAISLEAAQLGEELSRQRQEVEDALSPWHLWLTKGIFHLVGDTFWPARGCGYRLLDTAAPGDWIASC